MTLHKTPSDRSAQRDTVKATLRIQSRPVFANYSRVPLLVYVDGLGLDVRGARSEFEDLIGDILEMLLLLSHRDIGSRRVGIVYEDDG